MEWAGDGEVEKRERERRGKKGWRQGSDGEKKRG